MIMTSCSLVDTYVSEALATSIFVVEEWILLLFIKIANGLLTRWQLYYSKTQQAMTHITEITATLKQNTAHRTTQAIKDTKYSANHYRYIINNEK
jgi:low affinity Fe/Cu permease